MCVGMARLFVFLSSSRAYPIAPLRALRLEPTATRFVLGADAGVPGVSAAGISERFPLYGNRSLYGATKLAAELQSYVQYPRARQSLWRDLGSMADGQSGPRSHSSLDGSAFVWRLADLYGFWRRGFAGSPHR